MRGLKKSFLVAASLLVAIGSPAVKSTPETSVQLLTLGPPLNTPAAQISGLAWCQDKLLLLPQKPEFASSETTANYALYMLSKAAIKAALKDQHAVLQATPVVFDDHEFRQGLNEFDGYEAIVCQDHQLWLAVETKVDDSFFTTTIVDGQIDLSADPPAIKLANKALTVIQSQSGIWNFSEETLILDKKNLIAIHESNNTIDKPYATSVDTETGAQSKLDMASVAYRITDATALDKNKFWVLNYLWKDLEVLKHLPDPLAAQYAPGSSHRNSGNLERLVELRLSASGIELSDTPPIYLELREPEGRNWEGIVRLDDLGLLLVTDEHPQTYFGFVPF